MTLREAAEAISAEAGQMDGHLQAPVLISYASIIALRAALDEEVTDAQVAIPPAPSGWDKAGG